MQKTPLILFIEDEPAIAQMYQTAFELRKLDLALAKDTREGWDLTLRRKPDLVLLDIILPKEMGLGSDVSLNSRYGFEYLEKVKNNPETKDIPVVVLTNLDTNEDRVKSEELGATDYIIKANVIPQEIVEKVKHILSTIPTQTK